MPSESGGPDERRGAGREGLAHRSGTTKVEPGSFELNEKLGVGSLVKLPWAGPAVMLAWGRVVSAVKLLNAE